MAYPSPFTWKWTMPVFSSSVALICGNLDAMRFTSYRVFTGTGVVRFFFFYLEKFAMRREKEDEKPFGFLAFLDGQAFYFFMTDLQAVM